MANPERARLIMLGLATWTELEAAVSTVIASTMRNDATAVEAARAKAHDLLDHHLDAKIEGITLIRLDVEKQTRDL